MPLGESDLQHKPELLQQEGGGDLLGFVGIDGATANDEAVITANELIVDDLAAAVGVFDEEGREAVHAVSRDACGIG